MRNDFITLRAVLGALGMSEDTASNWARRGLVDIAPSGRGRGRRRRLTVTEATKLAIMQGLTVEGYSPHVAAALADDILADMAAAGETVGTIDLRRSRNCKFVVDISREFRALRAALTEAAEQQDG